MSEDRQVIHFNPKELDGVEPHFQRLTGIDSHNVPKRYGDAVAVARSLVEDATSASAVVQRIPIASRDEASVRLATGHVLPCPTCARALEDSDCAILFVLSLHGLESVKSQGMLEDFFVDMWASAITERAQTKLADLVLGQFAESDSAKRTHIWDPGQHDVEFAENQRVIFDILKPDEIGCVLTDSLMMTPVKSSSGIFGIVPSDTVLPRPCEHCPREAKCAEESAVCAAL